MIGTITITSLTSITIGYCIKYKKSFVKTFSFIFVASLLGNIIDMFLYIKVFLGSTINEQINLMIESAKSSSEYMTKLTGSAASVDFNTLIFMLPGGLVLVMLLSSLLTYIICMRVMRRFNYKMEPIRNFSNWYVDIRVIIVIMIISTVGYLMNIGKIPFANYIMLSSEALLQFTMAIIGAAVVDYFLEKKFNLKKSFRVIIIIMLFISSMNQILFLIGLFDSIVDVRKIGFISFNKALKSKKVKPQK
jgi:Predicted membrane protein